MPSSELTNYLDLVGLIYFLLLLKGFLIMIPPYICDKFFNNRNCLGPENNVKIQQLGQIGP